MKHLGNAVMPVSARVAPRAGAWIETLILTPPLELEYKVAPRAGAWIETRSTEDGFGWVATVAPRAGAWIETALASSTRLRASSRPPRGGVD